MTNIDYKLSLTPGQRRFFELIDKLGFSDLWDMKERSYQPETISRYLDTSSHGEAIMLRFCLGVWRGDNEYAFDFVDAAKMLEPSDLAIITDWMTKPFFP